MTKKIWKFEVSISSKYNIQMPKGSHILTADMQNDNIKIWAIVEPTPVAEWVNRTVYVYGTGQPLTADKAWYTATVFDGSYVWHVFVGDEDDG